MHLESRRSALALTAFLASAVARAASGTGSLETVPGLHVAMFDIPSGKIYVNLPDDLAPGDTVSGTVNPVPAGPSERDRARQLKDLNGYLLELGGQRAPTTQRVRRFVVPAGVTNLAIVLLDAHGRPIGDVSAPVGAAVAPSPTYLVPPVGQSGRAVSVRGPFDGDLSAAAVQIGGKPAQAMAESPRQLVVRGPEEGASPAPLEVTEHGKVVTTGTYRNVAVQLSAPMTNLLAGQHTRLTITVTGLEGLRQTLPLLLANGSPGVVRMEGGDEQTLCVRPDEVKPAGKWTKDRDLTGVRGGGFSIHADLTRPRPHVESSTPMETTLHGWLHERLVLDEPARTAAGEALAAGPYDVVVRGAPEPGRVHVLLGHNGKPAGTVEGSLFKHVAANTICDTHDVTDAAQKAGTGPKDSGLNELGFADDGVFAVRREAGRLHLVLTTPQGDLSIEADLALLESEPSPRTRREESRSPPFCRSFPPRGGCTPPEAPFPMALKGRPRWAMTGAGRLFRGPGSPGLPPSGVISRVPMPQTRPGAFRLFRLAGIDVFLHWTWFVVAAYEVLLRRGNYRSPVWNVVEYLTLFVIVTLHEFGHSLACRQVGGTANQVLLWPLGGLAYVNPPQRPGATLWSTAAGPLVNVLLIPILMCVSLLSRYLGLPATIPDLSAFLHTAAQMNLFLLIFNLLPVYPLDGGQILRSLLWFVLGRARSLTVATALGLLGVLGLVGVAVLLKSFLMAAVGVFVGLSSWRGFQRAGVLSRLATLPRREGFACPSCGSAPPIGPFWACAQCHKRFDTFETHAVCPNCGAQFALTSCVDCGIQNPLSAWAAAAAPAERLQP